MSQKKIKTRELKATIAQLKETLRLDEEIVRAAKIRGRVINVDYVKKTINEEFVKRIAKVNEIKRGAS